MGFDLNINLTLSMCEETGDAYLGYGKVDGKLQKIYYDREKHCVPKHLRPYLTQRGRYLSHYTWDIEQEDCMMEASVEKFYEAFPNWDDIKDEEEIAKWEITEDDHNKFFELIKWLYDMEMKYFASYKIYWSY